MPDLNALKTCPKLGEIGSNPWEMAKIRATKRAVGPDCYRIGDIRYVAGKAAEKGEIGVSG
ncbi:hypothetical protein ACFMPD_02040 [Sedimentitalea sp. HM32M-2]|uniref:hypothetical protein n=1 Tax=Sedimentitalea sp. HM32M-2 TaxID=3351566 RepID=UPI003640299B